MDKEGKMLCTIERERRGMSQAELARLVGCNPTSISRIESGKEPPFPIRGQKIADALEWEGDYMELFETIEGAGE